MRRRFSLLARDRGGAAAAEMALVLPLLLILLFGTVEAGNFFLNAQVVEKGVRDAARYAARVPLSQLATDCDTLNTSSGMVEQIQAVARTGDPDGAATPRLGYWTDDSTVTVEIACDTSGTYSGVYFDFPFDPPVVTVSAELPYFTLFPLGGLNPLSGELTLHASDQTAVFGA